MEVKSKWLAFAVDILISGVYAVNARSTGDERLEYPLDWTAEDKREFLEAMQSVAGPLPKHDPNDMKLPDRYLCEGLAKMINPNLP